MILLDVDTQIATLGLSTANVALMLESGTMRIGVQLGNLSLTDDSSQPTKFDAYKELVTIEGSNLLDLTYETFDVNKRSVPGGADSAVTLRSGSIKIHFLERPLHDLYSFMIKFARLKNLYDSATQAAVQKASEIQKMEFDVSIQSPIIVFPDQSLQSDQRLIVRLGEVSAGNEFLDTMARTNASLRGISLTSEFPVDGELVVLSIVDAVDINANVVQHFETHASETNPAPESEVWFLGRPLHLSQLISPVASQMQVLMTDVKMSLTQRQYISLMGLLQAIPRVFALESDLSTLPIEGTSSTQSTSVKNERSAPDTTVMDLSPELRSPKSKKKRIVRSKLDLVFQVRSVKLNLYNEKAVRETNFKETGIVRFALSDSTVRLKMLVDGALEVEVVLQTFTMTNTKPGRSRFREIIPAEKHREQAQIMILYSSSTGPNPSSFAVVSVDSPKILFALDPVFALLSFFTSAFPPAPAPQSAETRPLSEGETVAQSSVNQRQSAFAFRFDLHNASVTVLEDDEQPNSQAIRLAIKQISLSQQASVFCVRGAKGKES